MYADRCPDHARTPRTPLPNSQNRSRAFVQVITSSSVHQAEDDSCPATAKVQIILDAVISVCLQQA